MTHVDTTQLRTLGERLRRATTNREVLDFIDGALNLIRKPKEEVKEEVGCPECARRRKLKAEAQKRWRKKK